MSPPAPAAAARPAALARAPNAPNLLVGDAHLPAEARRVPRARPKFQAKVVKHRHPLRNGGLHRRPGERTEKPTRIDSLCRPRPILAALRAGPNSAACRKPYRWRLALTLPDP